MCIRDSTDTAGEFGEALAQWLKDNGETQRDERQMDPFDAKRWQTHESSGQRGGERSKRYRCQPGKRQIVNVVSGSERANANKHAVSEADHAAVARRHVDAQHCENSDDDLARLTETGGGRHKGDDSESRRYERGSNNRRPFESPLIGIHHTRSMRLVP